MCGLMIEEIYLAHEPSEEERQIAKIKKEIQNEKKENL